MYFAPIPCTHPKEVASRELLKGDLGSPGGISLRNDHRTTIKHKKNLGKLFPVPQALDWTTVLSRAHIVNVITFS